MDQMCIRDSDQSDDIAHAVREGVQTGAGDQGIMYGFACDETESYLPLPVILAHRLTRLLTNARKTGKMCIRDRHWALPAMNGSQRSCSSLDRPLLALTR